MAKKSGPDSGEKKVLRKKGDEKIAFRPQNIVEARYNLDRRQNDIMDIAFGLIDKDADRKEYSIRVSDVKEYYNIEDKSHAYRFLKQAVESLEGKGFKLKKDEDTSIYYPWFSKITYVRAKNEENSHIDFKMDDDLKRMIKEAQRGAFYDIRYAINLSNKYAKRLYYLFQDRKDMNKNNPALQTGTFTMTIEELLRMLDCPPSYKYTDFKRYVIKPSQEQINGSTDIFFEYEENRGKLRSGQKGVLSLTFHVTKLNPHPKVVAEAPFYEITSQHEKLKKRGYLDSEVRDIILMAKKYNRDDVYINEALDVVDHTKCDSRVAMACYFMKNGFTKPVSMMETSQANREKVASSSKQTTFSQTVHQRTYDYDELEKSLLTPKSEEVKHDDDQKEEKKEISVEELQSIMANNPQFQQEIASLLEKMNQDKD